MWNVFLVLNVILLVFANLGLIEAQSLISSFWPIINPYNECLVAEQVCPNPKVGFYLYTRSADAQILDLAKPETIYEAEYAFGRPLVVLFHGYTGHRDFSPNTEIRPAYLAHGEYNIISVDYKELVPEPCYISAVRNLPVVANCTAQLLDYLIDYGYFHLSDIHVIGFSLGAHTAGMVSNFIQSGRLPRITGLDPASPMFLMVANYWRLDYGDADYVDIIHTDVFERGVKMAFGHSDFYANGGYGQPGCGTQMELSPGSCNHARAPAYYAESIGSEEGFWGYKCHNWFSWMVGYCNENNFLEVARMGAWVDTSIFGSYFFKTNSETPFARGQNFSEVRFVPTLISTIPIIYY